MCVHRVVKTTPLLLLTLLGLLLAGTTSASAGTTKYLPKFSIGQPGTFVFEVDTPGEVLYPHWLYIDTRESRSYRPVTWFENATIKVEILDPKSQKVLKSRFLEMRAWRIVDSDELRVPMWGMRERDSFVSSHYLIRLTVMKPSSRRFDKARVQLGPAQ